MRFIPKLNNTLVFSSVSMFAIWTIIMTYFGVNYYLSGLHSYAAEIQCQYQNLFIIY